MLMTILHACTLYYSLKFSKADCCIIMFINKLLPIKFQTKPISNFKFTV